MLTKHPHRASSRDDLVGWLKGYERDAFDRSVDVRVTRLRRRIETAILPTRATYAPCGARVTSSTLAGTRPDAKRLE